MNPEQLKATFPHLVEIFARLEQLTAERDQAAHALRDLCGEILSMKRSLHVAHVRISDLEERNR